jgi:hypothetical protein
VPWHRGIEPPAHLWDGILSRISSQVARPSEAAEVAPLRRASGRRWVTSFIQRAEPLLPGIDGCGKGLICLPEHIDLSAIGCVQRSQDVLRCQSVDVFCFSHCSKDTYGASESFKPRDDLVPCL